MFWFQTRLAVQLLFFFLGIDSVSSSGEEGAWRKKKKRRPNESVFFFPVNTILYFEKLRSIMKSNRRYLSSIVAVLHSFLKNERGDITLDLRAHSSFLVRKASAVLSFRSLHCSTITEQFNLISGNFVFASFDIPICKPVFSRTCAREPMFIHHSSILPVLLRLVTFHVQSNVRVLQPSVVPYTL